METNVQERTQRALAGGQEAGGPGESAIVEGIPVQETVETAESRGIDLIVMGRHGRRGLTHALMGRVAEKVVRIAPSDVRDALRMLRSYQG